MPLDGVGNQSVLLLPRQQPGALFMLPPALPIIRFSRVLGSGVSVWLRRDSAMVLLTSAGNYKIDFQPFQLLRPYDAGLLQQATRVIFSLQDYPTAQAQDAVPGVIQALLKSDREGQLCLR